ncbi:MAG TPA: glycine zipper domain-containing protein [Blastocatellia bacterium]|nr:glycine zipper domain-containing protein [Blastocatellia bacterium]
MTRLDRFSSIIIVAVLAATAGWAASAFTSRHSENSTPAPQAVSTAPVNGFQASDQTIASPVAALSAVPSAPVTKNALSAGAPAAETASARVATRPRVVNPQATETRNENRTVYRSSDADRYEPRAEQKRGMSRTMKNVLVIGGGAAAGAAVGGIAGGKKGAAIGAIVGGGGGALYSWIKHKQNKPVF